MQHLIQKTLKLLSLFCPMEFKKFRLLLALPLALFAFVSCGKPLEKPLEPTSDLTVRIVATTAMVGDIAKRVGGSRVEVITLISGQLDPHTYELVKGDAEKVMNADLILYNGLGLEHGPSLKHLLESDPKAYAVGDYLNQKFPDQIIIIDGQIDPHIWMDISLWKEIGPFIASLLIEIDPVHQEEYLHNAQETVLLLETEHQQLKEMLFTLPSSARYLVTSHDAFNYFTRAYLAENPEISDGSWKNRCHAPEGLAPDSQLSHADIQEIVDILLNDHIHVIFPESNLSQDALKKIVDVCQKKGHPVMIASDPLYGDAMGEKGSDGDTYNKMIRHNAVTIYHYLNQSYDAP